MKKSCIKCRGLTIAFVLRASNRVVSRVPEVDDSTCCVLRGVATGGSFDICDLKTLDYWIPILGVPGAVVRKDQHDSRSCVISQSHTLDRLIARRRLANIIEQTNAGALGNWLFGDLRWIRD